MKRSQVEDACEKVLGSSVFGPMRAACPLPRILEAAALKAFREDWPNEGFLDCIRGALNMLEKDGYFQFDSEQ